MIKLNRSSAGFVVWIMGPTSSGKTTIAEHLLQRFRADQFPAVHYDGDEVRDFFGDSLGFEPADRLRVVSTLAHLANKGAKAGLIVIVSALTANEPARQHVRDSLQNLVTLYIECSIHICASRDPKGLYAKAYNNEIDTLIGVNDAYIPPNHCDFTVNSETLSPSESVDAICAYLQEAGWLSA